MAVTIPSDYAAVFSESISVDFTRNAYRKLSHDELVFFLHVRGLPVAGTHLELATRLAQYDAHTYRHHYLLTSLPRSTINAAVTTTSSSGYTKGPHLNGCSIAGSATSIISNGEPVKSRLPNQTPGSNPPRCLPDLPVEILALIMDHVGDWELARAVGVPTALPQPLEWTRASSTDHVMLPGYLPLIRAADPAAHPPTKVGAALVVRFGYVHVLEYLLRHHLPVFKKIFQAGGCDLIPVEAAANGRTAVLSWWKHAFEAHPDWLTPPSPSTVATAIDGASRTGAVASLEWFASSSGLKLEYTDAALEGASAKGHISVLDWWRNQHMNQGLPLKIGRVMDMASTAGHVRVLSWWAGSGLEFAYDRGPVAHASCHGHVAVLSWWLQSGLQMVYDPAEVLIGATRHNRPEVLEWWVNSGLAIQWRMCDVEEALEDAIGGGEEARKWWSGRGVDFNAGDREWMKVQSFI